MKLLNLKLRGLIGIKKGLGLQEIEIDFQQFAPGLVAITGKNGSGKTSLLETLSPFRQMVSREGSLASHFFLKDSYKILTFEQDGKIYESKTLIDALTGASESYLICNGVSLNDGKLNSFDIEIEKVLGTPELFFNSVFAGQKSRGISELKPAERRKLFYELLNLDVYEVYLEQAKKELRTNENELAEIEGEIKALASDQTSVDVLEDQRKTLLNNQANIISRMTDLEIEKDNLNKSIQELKVRLQLAEERQKQQTEIENKIMQLGISIEEATREHNTKVIRYNSEIEQNKKLIARNNKLLNNRHEIETKLSEKKYYLDQIETCKTLALEAEKEFSNFQKDYSEKLKQLGGHEKDVNGLRNSHNELIRDLKEIRQQVKKVTEETSLISEVPCDEQTGSSCKFLMNAYEGKKSLEGLTSRKTELEAKSLESERVLHDSESKLRADKQLIDENYQLKTTESNELISSIKKDIVDFNVKLKEIDNGNYEKLQEEAKNAESEIKLLELSIAGTEKLLIEIQSSIDENVKRIEAEIQDLKKKIDNKISQKIMELTVNIDRNADELRMNKEASEVLRKDLDKSNADVASIESSVEQIKKNEERIKKLNSDKSGIENEIKEWTFLTKAFDKTGIPVLKLENSGIEITSIANELLSIFENKFRIVFETTSLTKDKKKLKETFDINVVEEEGVTELSNKSGGERVWIETALRLAVSLVVRQQGKNIQTSFADEVDGALDLNNAHLFLDMLRNAHNKSGVHNTFFITHRPELIDLIPQRISLADGYLRVETN